MDSSIAARGLWLLHACCDDLDADALLTLPLGRRDAMLMELRTRLFGRQLESVANCPSCHGTLEAGFDLDALRQLTGTEHQLNEDGLIRELDAVGGEGPIRFRLPDSTDLLAMQACPDMATARDRLIQRCVVDIAGQVPSADAAPLSDATQTQIADAMADADPQADLVLEFTCPECQQHWAPVFDIARFLWQELHVWALRLLRDVDTLARVYHWSEADILAMSPLRRRAYLEQCVS